MRKRWVIRIDCQTKSSGVSATAAATSRNGYHITQTIRNIRNLIVTEISPRNYRSILLESHAVSYFIHIASSSSNGYHIA